MRTTLTLLALCLATVAWSDEPPRREPQEVARELLEVYGKKLDELTYIPALAVRGRLRYAELTDDGEQFKRVILLVNPYLERPPPAKSEVELAGHLVLAEYMVVLDEAQRLHGRLIAKAVDRHFGDQQRLPPDNAMSDSIFMRGPMMVEAARLSGDEKYAEMARKYLAGMRKLRQRDDGLYRHGHLCDAAWGRGNGFAAVGTAWYLSRTPKPDDDALAAFKSHLAALLKHQDRDGMWHQVIDVPESYAEFSCTCMIGFAMQRGISQGWLDRETYGPAVERAWQAVCARIEPGGKLRGVCEGTGTQPTLQAYLDRKAIHGVDQRGGAMALLFAVELMEKER